MKPHLYLLEGAGLIERLEDFAPSDPEDVDMCLVAHIGSEGEVGMDLFYFRLLTPKSLNRRLWADRYVWGREVLVVERFDYKFVYGLVKALCDRIEGDSWEEIAQRLSPYVTWEYDRRNPVDLSDY